MWVIWANQLLPKALKYGPKSNKSPNLVTLLITYRHVVSSEGVSISMVWVHFVLINKFIVYSHSQSTFRSIRMKRPIEIYGPKYTKIAQSGHTGWSWFLVWYLFGYFLPIFLKCANPGLLFIFVIFHMTQFKYKFIKHRWFGWDSNTVWQDGRCRKIHGAMTSLSANPFFKNGKTRPLFVNFCSFHMINYYKY